MPTDGPIRVMCVDDSADILALLQLSIAAEADMTNVGTRGSADGLLDEICRLKPDVLLLDTTMPGADPLDVVAQVRHEAPQTRIIIFSGYDDQASIDRAIEAGAWGFISKHAEMPILLSAIRRVAAGELLLHR